MVKFIESGVTPDVAEVISMSNLRPSTDDCRAIFSAAKEEDRMLAGRIYSKREHAIGGPIWI